MNTYDFERFSVRDKWSNSLRNKCSELHSTPQNIAFNMVYLLFHTDFFNEPDENITIEDYIRNHRLIDVYCKSGSILLACYNGFMFALRNVIPDRDDRDYFIVKYLLFGLCPDVRYLNPLRDIFYYNKKYDLSRELGNFYHYDLNSNTGSDKLKVEELLKSMEFDVVVGNPPYNNSIDIEFIKKAKELSNKVLMITSASYYSKRNRDDTILDNLSYVKYFPMSYDVFPDVKQLDGLCISLWDSSYSDLPEIENYWSCFSVLNTKEKRCIKGITPIINFSANLVAKFGRFNSLTLNVQKCKNKVYCIRSTDAISCYADYKPNNDTSHYITSPITVVDNSNTISGHYINLFESDSKFECESFKSYLETRFIRFLIMTGVYSLNSYTSHGFRFVPDPGSFDRIFEDKPLDGYTPDENGEYIDADGNKHCSLYVKYKLTQQEIDVIESVIRERK